MCASIWSYRSNVLVIQGGTMVKSTQSVVVPKKKLYWPAGCPGTVIEYEGGPTNAEKTALPAQLETFST